MGANIAGLEWIVKQHKKILRSCCLGMDSLKDGQSSWVWPGKG